ncbi:hypothetical protein GCM10027610_084380 [Dactylosporangium cerinum]
MGASQQVEAEALTHREQVRVVVGGGGFDLLDVWVHLAQPLDQGGGHPLIQVPAVMAGQHRGSVLPGAGLPGRAGDRRCVGRQVALGVRGDQHGAAEAARAPEQVLDAGRVEHGAGPVRQPVAGALGVDQFTEPGLVDVAVREQVVPPAPGVPEPVPEAERLARRARHDVRDQPPLGSLAEDGGQEAGADPAPPPLRGDVQAELRDTGPDRRRQDVVAERDDRPQAGHPGHAARWRHRVPPRDPGVIRHHGDVDHGVAHAPTIAAPPARNNAKDRTVALAAGYGSTPGAA